VIERRRGDLSHAFDVLGSDFVEYDSPVKRCERDLIWGWQVDRRGDPVTRGSGVACGVHSCASASYV
jgi:hypothetical protein